MRIKKAQVNIRLYPSTIIRLHELATTKQKSITKVMMELIDKAYERLRK